VHGGSQRKDRWVCVCEHVCVFDLCVSMFLHLVCVCEHVPVCIWSVCVSMYLCVCACTSK
jgi:hypothetical protein